MAKEDKYGFGDSVDVPTFEVILEMDDADDANREFSHSIVSDFLTQSEDLLSEMRAAIETKNRSQVSESAFYLKGQTSTLGFTKLRSLCEKIQNCANKMDETGTVDESDATKSLERIGKLVDEAKTEWLRLEDLMQNFYNPEQSGEN